jgi:N-acetylglucosaminyl-diphospho-decaprenol L-rhamnosyltransferase
VFDGQNQSRYSAALRLIDVVIINWNTVPAAVSAAEAFTACEEIEARVKVVDNLSRPEQRQLFDLQAHDSGIEIVLAERNLGFGGGANLGLRGGDAPLVCVSNADVVPDPGALAELARVALETPEAGMVGPVFAGGTQHYHSQLPGRLALLARSFVGSAGRRQPQAPGPGEIVQIGQVSGACFVMRRDVWEEVGGFDDDYFLWYDDVDLAKRLRDRGRSNLIVGSAQVRHAGAASFEQVDRRTAQAIRLASLQRYIEKHHSGLMPVAQPLMQASRAIRARGAVQFPAEPPLVSSTPSADLKDLAA